MAQSESTITLASIVQQSENQVSCELDGETVLMHLESGHYFGYDTIGSRVWVQLEEATSVDDLCKRLVKQFSGVDLETCRADVIPFLNELYEEGLLEIRQSASA